MDCKVCSNGIVQGIYLYIYIYIMKECMSFPTEKYFIYV